MKEKYTHPMEVVKLGNKFRNKHLMYKRYLWIGILNLIASAINVLAFAFGHKWYSLTCSIVNTFLAIFCFVMFYKLNYFTPPDWVKDETDKWER